MSAWRGRYAWAPRVQFAACLAVLIVLAGSYVARAAGGSDEPNGQDEFWAHLKEMRAGPVTFDLGGQVRLRYEYDDGFSIKGYQPGGHDQLLLERVRLDLTAEFWDRPRLFFQLQDAHPFLTRFGDADFPTSSPIEDTLDIRQLYAEWLRIGDSPFGFRIGRQQIAYGDQRVFGPGNWGNTGRFAWDAAMFIIDTDLLESDLWVGSYLKYKKAVWPDRSNYDFLTFVCYTHIKKLPFRLDLFYVIKNDRSGTVAGEAGEGDLLSHTIGFQAEGSAFDTLDAAGTFIAQFGKHGRDTVRAFGANVKVGATAPLSWKPRLGAQYTWGSGDSDPTDGVHQTFDGVFGGRDIFFYGYLNLFFWANLRDAEVDFSVKPWRGLTFYVEYHHFNLDQARDAWYTTGLMVARRDHSGASGTMLGDEVDARVVLSLWKHLELITGLGRFFPGGFVKATGQSGTASWYFFQAAYSW